MKATLSLKCIDSKEQAMTGDTISPELKSPTFLALIIPYFKEIHAIKTHHFCKDDVGNPESRGLHRILSLVLKELGISRSAKSS